MRIFTVIEFYGLAPRPHAKIMQHVMEKCGKRHLRRRVPKHFEKNRWTVPGGPYGYLERTGRTRWNKQRKGMDPFRPNFQTGALMAAVRRSSRITKTQYKWSWYAQPANSWALNRDRRKELEAMSQDEIDEDAEYIAKTYARDARTYNRTRIRRRRVG